MFEGNQRLDKAEGHGTGTCPAPSARFPSPVNSGGGDPPSLSCKKAKFRGKQTSQNLVPNFNRDESYFSRKCSSSISSCPSENGVALLIGIRTVIITSAQKILHIESL